MTLRLLIYDCDIDSSLWWGSGDVSQIFQIDLDSPSLRNQGVVMTDWVMVVIGVVVVVTLNLFVTLQKEKDIGPVIIQLFVNKIADASICHLYIIMNTFNPKFMNLSFTCHVL